MRYVIIEDEEMARKKLESMVSDFSPESELIASFDSVEEGLEGLPPIDDKADVILSDIELADGSCFEIFDSYKPASPVIFITAYDEYAIRAFKMNAIDYLLKPVKQAELEKALNSAISRSSVKVDYTKLAKAIMQEEKRYQKRFLSKIGTRFYSLNSEDAACFYSEHKTTMFCDLTGKAYPIDHSLEALEQSLDPDRFFRINRQLIVNRDSLKQLHQFSKGRVKVELAVSLPSDPELIVSTERSPKFKAWLER